MWPFNKKTLLSSGVFQGMTDYHSHILPGVDDGVQDIEESIAILKRYEQLGIAKVWCTPHVMEDIPNTPEDLRQRFDELCAAYDGPVKLMLASENMMDSLFDERLESGDLLPLGDEGNMLLVETSYFNPPTGMDRILDKIRSKGYFPVLAHPERYCYMDRSDFKRLSDDGVRFQMNLFSLTGSYGNMARSNAEWMLENNMYTYRGTDIHSISLLERVNCKIKKI